MTDDRAGTVIPRELLAMGRTKDYRYIQYTRSACIGLQHTCCMCGRIIMRDVYINLWRVLRCLSGLRPIYSISGLSAVLGPRPYLFYFIYLFI